MTFTRDSRPFTKGAAIATVSPRGQIAVAGNDRASYLQGLLTNDIQALTAGTGCYAAWLTPQGRMLTDLHVFEAGDMILLDVPAELVKPTLGRLDQFLFSEDVQLADLTGSLSAVWVHGPEAARILESALAGARGLASWTEYQNQRAEFGGAPVVVVRVSQLGVPGYGVYIEPGRVAALTEALGAAGAAPASREAVEAARVEAGYPTFGVDMTDTTIPLEAGIEERAISLTKGCYVGQEVIIRVLHRGHGRVARKLVGLQVAGEPPSTGAKLFSESKEIGHVTSSASSPGRGAIALGYVQRDFVTPGTAVDVETGGGRVRAVVTARPMPPAAG